MNYLNHLVLWLCIYSSFIFSGYLLANNNILAILFTILGNVCLIALCWGFGND